MKKILWFSIFALSDTNHRASGSWLYSMAHLLVNTPDVYLTNITVGVSKTKGVQHICINDNFDEYILPNWRVEKDGCPSMDKIQEIADLCARINPDIVHVWGIERYFARIISRLNVTVPVLLEIQGILRPCAEVFYGDMTFKDTLRCLGLREILFPHLKSIYALKHQMYVSGVRSEEAFRDFQYISTQSRWVRDQIKPIAPKAKLYNTGMSLRKDFWNSNKWQYPQDSIRDFYCSASAPLSYKSIQTAIKALAIVTKLYPTTKLYVIGNFKTSNWLHQTGYLTFLLNLIKKLNVQNNVVFTGPLNAAEIIQVMHKCVGMVQTSYVESYSLAVAEAQAVGIPSIISYAGAMPELATDRETGLFFSPGDYRSCAARMLEIIEDKELAEYISEKSYTLAHERNNDTRVLACQLKIYQDILQDRL